MGSEQYRRLVRQRAKYLCEYCHSPEYLSPDRFELDHILPRSLGGTNDLENLALACRRCDQRRYNFTTGLDVATQTIQLLFHPRQQNWFNHFVWIANGLIISGTTPIGRVTCDRLDLNDDFHDERAIVKARQFWIQGKWHPPETDPCDDDFSFGV